MAGLHGSMSGARCARWRRHSRDEEVIMSKLLEPLAVGELELPNRVVMAPLTRNRATMPGRVPNGLMREYYVQRASAGMILTEATSVDPMGVGYPNTPGIWSQE